MLSNKISVNYEPIKFAWHMRWGMTIGVIAYWLFGCGIALRMGKANRMIAVGFGMAVVVATLVPPMVAVKGLRGNLGLSLLVPVATNDSRCRLWHVVITAVPMMFASSTTSLATALDSNGIDCLCANGFRIRSELVLEANDLFKKSGEESLTLADYPFLPYKIPPTLSPLLPLVGGRWLFIDVWRYATPERTDRNNGGRPVAASCRPTSPWPGAPIGDR